MSRSVKRGWCLGVGVVLPVVLVMGGCSEEATRVPPPPGTGTTPVTPMPVVGTASLAGRVVGPDGQAVAGATVVLAETDSRATTDAVGGYQMMVPSDSTITVMATAAGFAPTFRESVLIASQAVVTDFDVLLLAPDTVAAINRLGVAAGAAGQENTRGLMAVRLHSIDPACDPSGAQIDVWPPLAASVVYSRPGAGALDEPDAALTAVEPGTQIAFWLVGTLPPGNGLAVSVHKAGCQLMGQSPSSDGLMFPGQRHVVAQSLTEADLFLTASR